MDQVLQVSSNHKYTDNRLYLFFLAIVCLIPLSLCESMKHLSYISLPATISILIALVYVIINDASEIENSTITEPKTYNYFVLTAIPLFFGISNNMFEGNAVAL